MLLGFLFGMTNELPLGILKGLQGVAWVSLCVLKGLQDVAWVSLGMLKGCRINSIRCRELFIYLTIPVASKSRPNPLSDFTYESCVNSVQI